MIQGTQKQNKITKYRKYSFFNIGTLLFGTVFIYMVITFFMYLTDTHVTSYEVRKGSITGNYRYQALALRTEQVVNATQSGSIRYFEREGVKTSAGSAVCAVNESGSADPVAIADFTMTDEDAMRLKSSLSSFTINYSSAFFQKTYDLKAGIESTISEIIEEHSGDYVSRRNQIIAPESGFVVYKIDGFEQITEEQLTQDMFLQNNYSSTNLRNQKTVSAGSPVFKLITEEEWYLYFPLDNKLVTELTDTTKIRFRFLKDNVTFTSPFTMIQNGSDYYGRITLDSSLVRYATDRYLEIELVMNKKTGLKIPVSSIVERAFYKIPEEYAIQNKDTNSEIVLKVQNFGKDGSSSVKYKTANVYEHSDGFYLVDQNLLNEGDYILIDNSTKQMQIQEKDVAYLHGVYCINKGYAVFKEINVIDGNEEYCIVESANQYGLAAYDYIVLNAADVQEDEIVY